MGARARVQLSLAEGFCTQLRESSMIDRRSRLRVGSLMLTLNDAEKSYSLNTVHDIRRDGVREMSDGGKEQRAAALAASCAAAASAAIRGVTGEQPSQPPQSRRA